MKTLKDGYYYVVQHNWDLAVYKYSNSSGNLEDGKWYAPGDEQAFPDKPEYGIKVIRQIRL